MTNKRIFLLTAYQNVTTTSFIVTYVLHIYA